MNLQGLYDASPVFAQNIGISLLGLRARLTRYGGDFKRKLSLLREWEALSRSELEALQTSSLRRCVALSQSVPHYRDLIDWTRVDLTKLRPGDLPHTFPVLNKLTVRSSPTNFHSMAVPDRKCTVLHTSGTSGSPLAVRATIDAIRWNYAFFARFLSWHGVSPFSTSATLAGRLIVPQRQSGPPYHRRNRGLNDTLLSSYRISPSTAPEYLRVLECVRPALIDAYPSAISALAEQLDAQGLRARNNPTVVVTSSETLLSTQRATIERVFGCPVRDQYGSAELSVFACECEQGSLHVNSDFGIVEILRSDGSPASFGEVGRVVATGFFNQGMPLIRYEIGDSAVMDDRPCKCGRSFPVLREVTGRTDDLVLTPSGRLVGRMDPAFKGMPGIVEAQIVQTAIDSVRVDVVCSVQLDPVLSCTVREAIEARLEAGMRVVVRQVESIPRTRSGKFRSVVSELTTA